MPTIVTPVATSAFTVYSGRANTKGRKGGVAQDVGLSEAQLAMVGNVVEGRSRRSIVANPLSDPEHMAAIAAAAAGYNKSRERRSSNSNIASDALAAVGSAKKAARGTMKKLRRSLTIHAVSDADKEDPDGEEVNRYIEQKVNERRSRRSFYEAAPRTGAEETMLPNPVNVDTNADHAKTKHQVKVAGVKQAQAKSTFNLRINKNAAADRGRNNVLTATLHAEQQLRVAGDTMLQTGLAEQGERINEFEATSSAGSSAAHAAAAPEGSTIHDQE